MTQRLRLFDKIEICPQCGGPALQATDSERLEALTDNESETIIKQLRADLRWALYLLNREALEEEEEEEES
jgi:hypothetical protein